MEKQKKTWNKIIENIEDCESVIMRLRQNWGRALVMVLQLLLIMKAEHFSGSYNGICDSTALSCRNGKIDERLTNREYKEN